MSDRTTDASIAYDWKLVRRKTDAEEGPSMAAYRLEEELYRARASESEKTLEIARLLNEREELTRTLAEAREMHSVLAAHGVKQEEQIKALADALRQRGVRLLDNGGAWHLAACPVAASSPTMRPSQTCSEECFEAQSALRLVGCL